MKFLQIYEEFSKKRHKLSGVLLLVDDRVLLVHPKKFRGQDKWSIPKGHVEKGGALKSALQELIEETGISLAHRPDSEYKYSYKKNGVRKELTVFVYRLKKSQVERYLRNGWEIKRSIYDRKEIWKAKFFTLDKAKKRLESPLKGLLKKF